jgi:hypothetical protein
VIFKPARYRQKYEIRRFEWIFNGKQNTAMINAAFKVCAFGPSNREMPFKNIVLYEMINCSASKWALI